MTMPRDDTQAIKAALVADMPRLLQTLFNDKRITRHGHEWRIGTNGALSVRSDGCWYSHEAGAGGDILDLIAFALATDFKGALAFAKSYAGGAAVVAPKQQFPNFNKAKEASRTKQQARARNLWNQAQAIGGNHANG